MCSTPYGVTDNISRNDAGGLHAMHRAQLHTESQIISVADVDQVAVLVKPSAQLHTESQIISEGVLIHTAATADWVLNSIRSHR